MSETKEDAAERKRKLDEVLKEGQASKKFLLSELDKFEEVVQAIEQDPEWKWPPSSIKYSDQCVQWDDARMEAIQLEIVADLKFGVDDKDTELFEMFDTVKEALAHVAELHRVRNLPRIQQFMTDIRLVPLSFYERRILWKHLRPWAVAFSDFRFVSHKAVTNRMNCYVLFIEGKEHRFKIRFGDDEDVPEWEVLYPVSMVNLLSFPKQ